LLDDALGADVFLIEYGYPSRNETRRVSDRNADDITFEFELRGETEAFTGQWVVQSVPMPWTLVFQTVAGMVDLAVDEGDYKFRVRAKDTTGQVSAWSEPKSFHAEGDIQIWEEDLEDADLLHFNPLDGVY